AVAAVELAAPPAPPLALLFPNPPLPPFVAAMAVTLSALGPPVTLIAELAAPPEAPAKPPLPVPPVPPMALTLPVRNRLWLTLRGSANAGLELAVPPAPASRAGLDPPLPPVAVCDKLRSPPCVEPVTALLSVLAAPFPPLAPAMPPPPSPPACDTLAL